MKLKLLFLLFAPAFLFAQGYTSYFTGNATNITTVPEFGICLMGGATEHDNAMIWLVEKANGGDVVVLRCSGSDGYNDYLYSDLGVDVNSVETLLITSEEGALNPYVLDKVANAEMIWFAGGDQWNYVNFFKDNAMEDLLNAHVNVKNAPIGGTSAGMAILGFSHFSAQNGTVSSAAALQNPFSPNVTVAYGGFLHFPFLFNTITDSHYDNPDRRGRHVAFMARAKMGFSVSGIGVNEYVAVCINEDGRARVFGDYPNYEEHAYFVSSNCAMGNNPEVLTPGSPLTWGTNGNYLQVYKVPGTMNGANYFDLPDFNFPVCSGGSWEHWSVNAGVFQSVSGVEPQCVLSSPEFTTETIKVINPVQDNLQISNSVDATVELFDEAGRKVALSKKAFNGVVDVSELNPGVYFAKITRDNVTTTRKIIKR